MSDDDKQTIIDAYLKASPTPENSMDIVTDLANEHDSSPNSIRMILVNAGVYVKKGVPGKAGKTGSSDETKALRKSKQASIDELKEVIESAGQEVNEEILSKFTGKAAEYLIGVISGIGK